MTLSNTQRIDRSIFKFGKFVDLLFKYLHNKLAKYIYANFPHISTVTFITLILVFDNSNYLHKCFV